MYYFWVSTKVSVWWGQCGCGVEKFPSELPLWAGEGIGVPSVMFFDTSK